MTDMFKEVLQIEKTGNLKCTDSNLKEILSTDQKNFVQEKEFIRNNPISLNDNQLEDSSRILRNEVEDFSTDYNSSGKETIRQPEYTLTEIKEDILQQQNLQLSNKKKTETSSNASNTVEYLYSQFNITNDFNLMNVTCLNALNQSRNIHEVSNTVQKPAKIAEWSDTNHKSTETFEELHRNVQAQSSQAKLNFTNFSQLCNISPSSYIKNNNNFSLNSSIFNEPRNYQIENNLTSSSKQPVFKSVKKSKKSISNKKSSSEDITRLSNPYQKKYKIKKNSSNKLSNDHKLQNNKNSNLKKSKNINSNNLNKNLNRPEKCQNINMNMNMNNMNININFPMNFIDYNSLFDFNNLGAIANFNQMSNNFYSSNLPLNMINNNNENCFPSLNIKKETSTKEEALIQSIAGSSSQEKYKKQKDNYLHLLVIAAESLLEKGLLSKEEFNPDRPEVLTVTDMQSNCSSENTIINNSSNNNLLKLHEKERNLNLRDCDNKVCLISAPKNSELWVRTKIHKGKWANFCKTCHTAWKNGQFCFYCSIIYADNAGTHYHDTKNWVMCDYCEMWQHIQCEEENGYYSKLSNLLEDTEFKYMCPLCRKKNVNSLEFNDSTTANSNNSACLPDLKTKRKYKNKKPLRNMGILYTHQKKEKNTATSYEKEFLGQKLANENYEYQSLLKISKRKSQEFLNDTNKPTNCNFNILNSIDSRDIYHDFYKISNINQGIETKKK